MLGWPMRMVAISSGDGRKTFEAWYSVMLFAAKWEQSHTGLVMLTNFIHDVNAHRALAPSPKPSLFRAAVACSRLTRCLGQSRIRSQECLRCSMLPTVQAGHSMEVAW